MTKYAFAIACSDRLARAPDQVSWLRSQLNELYVRHPDALYLMGDVTVCDAVAAEKLAALGAHVLIYGSSRRELRGHVTVSHRDRRMRNVDHEIAADLHAAEKGGYVVRIVTFEPRSEREYDPEDPEDLEWIRIASDWYMIQVDARLYDGDWLAPEAP